MSYLFRSKVAEKDEKPAPTFDIPKECKAGVIVNEGPDFHVEVQMVPVPEPGPGELLIRLNATGICYSDLHFAMADLGTPLMSTFGVRSPGHEGAGVVVKVGSNVTNWKVGERAGMKPRWSVCGDCELCLDDKEPYCRKAVLCGLHKTGTYQQYVTSPAHYTQRIPDGVDDYTAAPIMCSTGTMYRALRQAGLKINNWAVFPGGGGGVGIQGVQMAAAMGLRPIVVDTGAERQKLALEKGAAAFVDFRTSHDPIADVIEIADGIGAHGVFVTAGGSYPDAIAYSGARVGAVVTCIGLPRKDGVTVGADPKKYITQGLTIRGCVVGGRNDIAAALQYAAAGKIAGDHTIYSIDQLPEAVEKVRRGEAVGRGVVDFNL
ncbi:chaperonin 10-like protein [Aspergillus pseudoustus]|uniref:Chaperonin 10-like protein n=1 Tax=Aspergillus pseudoustus TaxID=1810923 RepID=A0ABR4IY44_9EURO